MLATTFLKENRWNAIAGPSLSSDGLDLYFGVRENGIRGWNGAEDFHENANVAVENIVIDESDPRNRKLLCTFCLENFLSSNEFPIQPFHSRLSCQLPKPVSL